MHCHLKQLAKKVCMEIEADMGVNWQSQDQSHHYCHCHLESPYQISASNLQATSRCMEVASGNMMTTHCHLEDQAHNDH